MKAKSPARKALAGIFIAFSVYEIILIKIKTVKINNTIAPIKPISSETDAKIKSVCLSGRNKSWVPTPLPSPLPNNFPEPTEIVD